MDSLRRCCLVLALTTAACGSIAGDDCQDNPLDRHHAVNPATGECWEFPSSCDVPATWADCPNSGCPPEIICGAGTVLNDVTCTCDPIPPTGCMSDTECALDQHCDFTMPPMGTTTPPGGGSDQAIAASGTCVDNAYCNLDTECPAGQWCDTTNPPGSDCDPNVPGCGAPAQSGTCTRGTRPMPGNVCEFTTDCVVGEICPAEFGFCSATVLPMPPVPPICQSVCEAACTDDSQCSAIERCNSFDPEIQSLCPQPHFKSDQHPRIAVQCFGWCVPR